MEKSLSYEQGYNFRNKKNLGIKKTKQKHLHSLSHTHTQTHTQKYINTHNQKYKVNKGNMAWQEEERHENLTSLLLRKIGEKIKWHQK